MRLFGKIASMSIVAMCVIAILTVSNMDTDIDYAIGGWLKGAFIVLAVLLACISFTDIMDIGSEASSGRRSKQGRKMASKSRSRNRDAKGTAQPTERQSDTTRSKSRGAKSKAGKRGASTTVAREKNTRSGGSAGRRGTTAKRK